MNPTSHVLGGGLDPPTRDRALFTGSVCRPIVKYRDYSQVYVRVGDAAFCQIALDTCEYRVAADKM